MGGICSSQRNRYALTGAMPIAKELYVKEILCCLLGNKLTMGLALH